MHARVRVGDGGDEHSGLREGVLQVGDERDGASGAHLHRLGSPGRLECLVGDLGVGPLERHDAGSARLTRGDLDLGAVGGVGAQVLHESLEVLGGIATGGHPKAHLGAAHRGQDVDGLGHRRGVDGQHGQRGAGPHLVGGVAGAEPVDAVQDRGLGAQPLLGVLHGCRFRSMQTRHGDVAVLVVQGGQQFAHGGEGVGHDAAELSGVQRVVQGAQFDDAVSHSTQGGGDRGFTLVPVHRVGDDDDVSGELVLVGLDDGGHGRRADLLLVLDEEGDTHRRIAVEGLERREMGDDSALVVGTSTPEQALTAFGGDEWFGVPLGDVPGGLDVTVGVQQDGRLTLGGRPMGDDGGQPPGLADDGGVGSAGGPSSIGDRLGMLVHPVGVEGADGLDGHELAQLLDGPVGELVHLGPESGKIRSEIHAASLVVRDVLHDLIAGATPLACRYGTRSLNRLPHMTRTKNCCTATGIGALTDSLSARRKPEARHTYLTMTSGRVSSSHATHQLSQTLVRSSMTLRLNEVTTGYRSGWRLGPISAAFDTGVTALVGPNGAGKTTLLSILAGIRKPQSGMVNASGQDLSGPRQWDAYRRALGIVTQNPQWPGRWAVRDFLRLNSVMYCVPRSRVNGLIDTAVEMTGTSQFLGRTMGTLSGGQRQRVFLAAALVHDPSVVILDEPTVGLDPAERASFREHIVALGRERVVIVSTHLMDDVALTADMVMIMDDGHMTWRGNVGDLEDLAMPDASARISPAEAGYLSVMRARQSSSSAGRVRP